MGTPSLARLHTLEDPAVPGLGELLRDGGNLWRAAGHDFEGDAPPVQVRWQPGRSMVVRYETRPTDGSPASAFVAQAGGRMPEGVAVLRSELGEVGVWPVTSDPGLPGLGVALDPQAVREMLAPLGVPRGPVALRLRAYRPGRRAVVEATMGGHRFFVKVLRPSRIEALQLRHRALEGILPVPASHGWSSDLGLVVLEARRGATLREALVRGEAIPHPREIRDLLVRLPKLEDRRTAASQAASGVAHIDLVRRLAPEATRALEGYDFASAMGASTRAVTVHGDLHESQLLVEDGRLVAMLDVDTAGLGDPRDDWATFLGHLHVRALDATGDERRRTAAYALQVAGVLLEQAETDRERAQVEARVAAVILGLATGPFAVMAPDWADLTDRRVDLAVRWLRGEGLVFLDDLARDGAAAGAEGR